MPAPTQTKFEVNTFHEVNFMCGNHDTRLTGLPTWFPDNPEDPARPRGLDGARWMIDTDNMECPKLELPEWTTDNVNNGVIDDAYDIDSDSWYIMIDGTRIG